MFRDVFSGKFANVWLLTLVVIHVASKSLCEEGRIGSLSGSGEIGLERERGEEKRVTPKARTTRKAKRTIRNNPSLWNRVSRTI